MILLSGCADRMILPSLVLDDKQSRSYFLREIVSQGNCHLHCETTVRVRMPNFICSTEQRARQTTIFLYLAYFDGD
jgi:hypothetical protein